MLKLEKATVPTMYFIGVTTTKSSIMKVFPEWANALGLENTVIKGIDLPIHAQPQIYREVVDFIKCDPLSRGALVTTHKLDLYNAASDYFEYLDPYAKRFGELSSISKREKELCGHAKDPISSGLAISRFIPNNYWKENPDASVFIMGAGGSAIAMCSYFMRDEFAGNYPARIVIANRSQPRLDEIQRINESLTPGGIELEYHLTPEPCMNDKILTTMAPGSLIINATGLGKDRPGSPLSKDAVFPQKSFVWEINYRGDLLFMQQAALQKDSQNLTIVDGWMYFIFGWTQVIAEVFHVDINDDTLDRLDHIAAKFNNR
ncbi:MAG: shikimate dehydrogenase [Planctomycetia bacterium]|nr:shikimate dehydrogenase [Planctomycetia bacterium]